MKTLHALFIGFIFFCFLTIAIADEPLEFGSKIEIKPEVFNIDNHYLKWKHAPDYKNERLAYYQDKLREQGITDTNTLRWLIAQLIQENGSFNESGIYHGNCVFGIPQINTCGRFNMKATEYLELHPEWRDWRYQVEQMAIQTKQRFDRFDGEISCGIVAHFHPYNKNGASGLYKRYGNCKNHVYWYSHVAKRLSLVTI